MKRCKNQKNGFCQGAYRIPLPQLFTYFTGTVYPSWLLWFRIRLLCFYLGMKMAKVWHWSTITYWFSFREREEGREKHRFVFHLCMHLCIHWCFSYVPWPGTKPATVGYQDDALTNWAAWPGLKGHFFRSRMDSIRTCHSLCRFCCCCLRVKVS